MSFIIAVYVNEGIVLASDRRTTYNQSAVMNGVMTQIVGLHTTDSTEKTFICPNGSGLMTCGDGSLMGRPLTGYIQAFIRENVDENTKVSEIPNMLLQYFGSFETVPNSILVVAGYENEEEHSEQKVFRISMEGKSIETIDTSSQGATWNGETLTLARLVQPVAFRGQDGTYTDLPTHEIAWGFFTIQDAIDFARFAVDVTIKTMHFVNVVETVGGDTDILVITPDETKWVQHKVLS